MQATPARAETAALLEQFGIELSAGGLVVMSDFAKAESAYIHHSRVPVAVVAMALASPTFARGRFPKLRLVDVVAKAPSMDGAEKRALAAARQMMVATIICLYRGEADKLWLARTPSTWHAADASLHFRRPARCAIGAGWLRFTPGGKGTSSFCAPVSFFRKFAKARDVMNAHGVFPPTFVAVQHAGCETDHYADADQQKYRVHVYAAYANQTNRTQAAPIDVAAPAL